MWTCLLTNASMFTWKFHRRVCLHVVVETTNCFIQANFFFFFENSKENRFSKEFYEEIYEKDYENVRKMMEFPPHFFFVFSLYKNEVHSSRVSLMLSERGSYLHINQLISTFLRICNRSKIHCEFIADLTQSVTQLCLFKYLWTAFRSRNFSITQWKDY